nr:hypothetical protein [Candidatus Sigynarchaeota archaeon]
MDVAGRKHWFIGFTITGCGFTLASFVLFTDFFSALHAFAPGDLGNPEGLVWPLQVAGGFMIPATWFGWFFFTGRAVPVFRAKRSSPWLIRRTSMWTLITACLAAGNVAIVVATWATLNAVAAGNPWFDEQFWTTGWHLLVFPFSTAAGGLACIALAWGTSRAQVRATRDHEYETCPVCGRDIGDGFFITTITCVACGRAACTRCMPSSMARLCTTDRQRLTPEQETSVGRMASIMLVLLCLVAAFGTVGGNLLSSFLFPTRDVARYLSWILLVVAAWVAYFLVMKIVHRNIKKIARNVP